MCIRVACASHEVLLLLAGQGRIAEVSALCARTLATSPGELDPRLPRLLPEAHRRFGVTLYGRLNSLDRDRRARIAARQRKWIQSPEDK